MKASEFASKLFEVETMAHIAHLQTSSFAEHSALNELYSGIVGLRDRFIEGYQGKYGIIKGYKSFTIKEGVDMVDYIEEVCDDCDEMREELEDGYLQQIIDDIVDLMASTLYKLKFLS